MERSYRLHDFSGSFNKVPAAYAACLCFPDGKYAENATHLMLFHTGTRLRAPF